MDEVDKRRKRSQAGSKGSGPWATDYEAMVLKTAIRALLGSGLVPMEDLLAEAIEDEVKAEVEAIRTVDATEVRPDKGIAGLRHKLGVDKPEATPPQQNDDSERQALIHDICTVALRHADGDKEKQAEILEAIEKRTGPLPQLGLSELVSVFDGMVGEAKEAE